MTSDILDVLNISEKTRVEGNELKRKRSEQKENAANSAKRQRAGQMNRELFNLIGPNLPPVSVKRNTIKFKEKLKLNKEVKWEWQAFTPRSGVKNGPKFHHWVKTTVNKSQNTSTEADKSTSGQDNSNFK
ncbi:component of the swr1p complex that incorporates htz1p into chromatin [Brettanomyces bruxellensis AWRI1499]|nr:component of the swr1p complex that incorporates htz1p into chromatin [Brettanomyces bruxellensis AWRI1499]